MGEWFNVRTAWHGPGDVSPVGHAANIHMDLALWNFGIQKVFETSGSSDSEILREIFPGMPTLKNGYLYVNLEFFDETITSGVFYTVLILLLFLWL
jgi:mannonate dehydratase